MYLELAQLLVALIPLIESLSNDRNSHSRMGHALRSLHEQLSDVVRNGDRILQILVEQCNGDEVDLEELGGLLNEQGRAFFRVNAALASHDIQQGVSIHAPEIEPMWVLIAEKENRLRLLCREVEPPIRMRDLVSPAKLRSPVGIIDFPDIASVQQSQIELNRLRDQLEKFRLVIVNNFSIGDVI